VDRVRKALGVRRIGHTGTLDPFATGVLPVCVGKATRLVRFLAEGAKVYRATVRFGFATTTDDRMGEPLQAPRAVALEALSVRDACARLTGETLQLPPFYSAKRVAGRRLYELAREGAPVERRAVPVRIDRIEVIALTGDLLEIEVGCSPGTYIRAIARDLGEILGVGGHLAELRRTWTSGFGLEGATLWDEIQPAVGARLRPMAGLLPDIPAVRVGAPGLAALRQGRDLGRRLVEVGFPTDPPARMRILDEAGCLVALAVPRGFGPPPGGLPVEPVLHPDVVLLG
jgi:tRNA pseudouridine55 synthase